ncbi:VWA domain-containing protein [Cutibacterium sp. WCA-380-WT-3A]|uniref:VWA domain-containing protein n=1 Tax=Cutibacterium porci TaxID=2605781 RepID=A0A7K0J9J1_9ACTN|nr:VWA domain-containing protein [Cutibacterium porci]MSS46616.1 VWA domain-containing protein [Cutibacterium porci]
MNVSLDSAAGDRHASRVARLWSVCRPVLLVVFAVMMIWRPAWGTTSVSQRATMDTDVVLVVDRTASMGALDGRTGTRADDASADIEQIVTKLTGARFTLIAFDNAARVEVPETGDAATIIGAAKAIGWQDNSNGNGSDISVAVPLVAQTLHDVGQRHPRAHKYLYYLGDGEQTATTPVGSFSAWKAVITQGWVLGYGTPTGSVMKRSPVDATKVTRGPTTPVSKASPASLTTIAGQFGATFVDRSDASPLVIPDPPRVVQKEESGLRRGEVYPWAAVAAAVVVVAQVVVTSRAWWRARKEK